MLLEHFFVIISSTTYISGSEVSMTWSTSLLLAYFRQVSWPRFVGGGGYSFVFAIFFYYYWISPPPLPYPLSVFIIWYFAVFGALSLLCFMNNMFHTPLSDRPGLCLFCWSTLVFCRFGFVYKFSNFTYAGVMGCGAAEATGLGFVCFVVINPRVLSSVLFINFPILRTLEWWDVVLQKRLAWALFVLFLSTLVCCQLTELMWVFFLFHKFSNFTPPPQDLKTTIFKCFEILGDKKAMLPPSKVVAIFEVLAPKGEGLGALFLGLPYFLKKDWISS